MEAITKTRKAHEIGFFWYDYTFTVAGAALGYLLNPSYLVAIKNNHELHIGGITNGNITPEQRYTKGYLKNHRALIQEEYDCLTTGFLVLHLMKEIKVFSVLMVIMKKYSLLNNIIR